MLAAEGQVHKRMRRVGNPAFSAQNMRALVPVVFRKAEELKEKWNDMVDNQTPVPERLGEGSSIKMDVCHWVSRATFDVIGLAGKSTSTPSSY